MKKLFCILLTLCLLCGVAFASEPLDGGWSAQKAEALPLPEEAAEAFQTAMDGLVGAEITPVALLSEQVVAGMNYCVLCWVEPVVPDPVGYYSLAYIYADLSGGASLVGFADLEYGLPEEEEGEIQGNDGMPVAGGWTVWENEPAALPEEAEKALNTALEGLVGAEYAPIALLAEQVVAGMNYCVLCTVTPVVPDATPSCALVWVYADLQGGAEITAVESMTFDLASVSG